MDLVADVSHLAQDVFGSLFSLLGEGHDARRINIVVVLEDVEQDDGYGNADHHDDVGRHDNLEEWQVQDHGQIPHHHEHVVHASLAQRKDDVEDQSNDKAGLHEVVKPFSGRFGACLEVGALQLARQRNLDLLCLQSTIELCRVEELPLQEAHLQHILLDLG